MLIIFFLIGLPALVASFLAVCIHRKPFPISFVVTVTHSICFLYIFLVVDSFFWVVAVKSQQAIFDSLINRPFGMFRSIFVFGFPLVLLCDCLCLAVVSWFAEMDGIREFIKGKAISSFRWYFVILSYFSVVCWFTLINCISIERFEAKEEQNIRALKRYLPNLEDCSITSCQFSIEVGTDDLLILSGEATFGNENDLLSSFDWNLDNNVGGNTSTSFDLTFRTNPEFRDAFCILQTSGKVRQLHFRVIGLRVRVER